MGIRGTDGLALGVVGGRGGEEDGTDARERCGTVGGEGDDGVRVGPGADGPAETVEQGLRRLNGMKL